MLNRLRLPSITSPILVSTMVFIPASSAYAPNPSNQTPKDWRSLKDVRSFIGLVSPIQVGCV